MNGLALWVNNSSGGFGDFYRQGGAVVVFKDMAEASAAIPALGYVDSTSASVARSAYVTIVPRGLLNREWVKYAVAVAA